MQSPISRWCRTWVGGWMLAAALHLPAQRATSSPNLALVAVPSASYVSGDTRVEALNDGDTPANSLERGAGSYGNWPRQGLQWVQYEWTQPISTKAVEVYWWDDHQGVRLPQSCRLLAWQNGRFQPVAGAAGLGVAADQFNRTTFEEVTTTKLRLEMTGRDAFSTGLREWRVLDSGHSPAFPPVVNAGIDRVVMVGGRTYLDGAVKSLGTGDNRILFWRKTFGPGQVSFENARSANTTATFSSPGTYLLELAATEHGLTATSTLRVRAEKPPARSRLDVVYTTPYRISSPLWQDRARALITRWIPHCIEQINRSDLRQGQGGIDNFVEAAKALRGETHKPHQGYVFANAWVHQTVESICLALMVDPQGDDEMRRAQDAMKQTLEAWIPQILAAQEPDGYLQTAYTLTDRKHWPERWNPPQRGNHEGYVAGYFIESAINHYTLTGGRDRRLYEGAKKLADCWVANLGPGRRAWFDGHQEMEQALVRFGRFVNDMEGRPRGDAYIRLAKFLLDCRRDGDEYDQSHVPVQQQYAAVGHAVRAVYSYSAMADVAAETRDLDYQSAVMSLWDNLVNRKYYVTGGVGSGETSEGFGPDYSLPQRAYCESCSSCGLIFFQHKLNLAYHDAKYADLYEETLYNALLGATDLEGRTFNYTNPLIDGRRTPWHACPCCVGNIPRTLLMIPTWAYVKGPRAVYVNLFIGSTVPVGQVAGTDVEMVQQTDYPWNGRVKITVNPQRPVEFTLALRVPDRRTSSLYESQPPVHGLVSLAINGTSVRPVLEQGYAKLRRRWKSGDQVTFELPMAVQRVHSDPKVEANRGQIALRYGPLIYNAERADQADLSQALGPTQLTAAWRGDLLHGIMVLQGVWANGVSFLAIPHFARMNRVGQGRAPDGTAGPAVDYSGGATVGTSGSGANTQPATATTPPARPNHPRGAAGPESIVWIREQPPSP